MYEQCFLHRRATLITGKQWHTNFHLRQELNMNLHPHRVPVTLTILLIGLAWAAIHPAPAPAADRLPKLE